MQIVIVSFLYKYYFIVIILLLSLDYIHQRHGKGNWTYIVPTLCVFKVAIASLTIMAVAQMQVASGDGCLDTPVGRENPVPPESESGTIEVTFGAVMGKTEKRTRLMLKPPLMPQIPTNGPLKALRNQ